MSKRKKIRCKNICAYNPKFFEADHLDTITSKIAKNNFVLADFNNRTLYRSFLRNLCYFVIMTKDRLVFAKVIIIKFFKNSFSC